MTADHESRLRLQELWAAKHETECGARHLALNLRFDKSDTVTESAILAADGARKAAEIAVQAATAASSAAAIRGATILGWLKALVFSVATAIIMMLSGSPIGQFVWKVWTIKP